MDAITNAISDSCEPKIYPDVTLQSIDDKTIIVVEIFAYMKIIEKMGEPEYQEFLGNVKNMA